jgi:Na+-transporting methylmalonyl-CoA/oxaloacetate decarboxylase gamma subunit
MFLQEATANTDGYMIAGYAVAFIVMALYVASIYIRSRNLNRDLTILEEMDKPAEINQPKSRAKQTVKTVTKRGGKK